MILFWMRIIIGMENGRLSERSSLIFLSGTKTCYFHGKEVSRIACECVGGNVTTDFQYELGSAKGSDGRHEGANGLLKALVQYGNPAKRLSGFTDRDLSYARRNNATAKLMEEYAYSYPVF
mmetsp:Transcript_25282/g.42903  ORF Transcript_25282/g.42903 Transcript_25282/m.42903 type:complete len:121 (-) Transcript_25282:115-477(-)